MEPIFKPSRYIRDYFDLGEEFDFASKEDKLLEIANCVYHGYNLYDALKEHCEEHPERDSSFCISLCQYIELVRGEQSGIMVTIRHLFTLKQLCDLFKNEVISLYRFPRYGKPYFASVKGYYDGIIKKYSGKGLADRKNAYGISTPLAIVPITEDELREINPWYGPEQFVKPIKGPVLFDENTACVLKCDEPYITEFNEQYKGTPYEYRIQKWPKPFMGNPLTAKVVLLSLNPGFKDRQKRLLAKALDIYYCEAIKKHLHEQTDLKAVSMFCPNYKSGDLDITYLEAHTLVDNYWYDMIEKIRNDARIPKSEEYFDPLYTRLSVIEYLGYASESYEDLAKGRILPSQHFTKLLIQYLTFNSDKTFVVVRSEKRWRRLIGEEMWDYLAMNNRLILGKKARRQSLTDTGLEKEDYNRLVELLK